MKNIKNTLVFLLYWFLFIFIFIFIGKIEIDRIITLLVINFIIVILISFLFNRLNNIFSNRIKYKLILVVLILISIDQFFKYIVFSGIYKISILKNLTFIEPVINIRGSFLAELFQINIPFYLYIMIYFISIVIIAEGYRYYIKIERNNFWTYWTLLFLLSGIFSSLINKIIWKESIDYIFVNPLFHADLKDFLLLSGLYTFIMEVISNKNNLRKIMHWRLKKEVKSSKKFLKFLKNDIDKILRK